MRRVALFFLLLGCMAAPVAARTVVTGSVVGPDGKPMVEANVFLRSPYDTSTVASGRVANDGRFRIIVPSKGIWLLVATGVHFEAHTVALYIRNERRLGVDIRLSPYTYMESLDGVKAYGTFDSWYYLRGVSLRRQPNGTYVAEIRAKTPTITYSLMNVRYGGDFAGTQRARYVYNSTRGYESVIPVKHGVATIVFDPRKLVRSGGPARVAFSDASQLIARFNEIYDQRVQFQDAYRKGFRAYMASRRGRAENGFKFDFASRISATRKELDAETNKILRSELYLNSLLLREMKQENDTHFYSTALDEISPASEVWALAPHAIYYALNHSSFSDREKSRYVERILESNPVRRVKSALLFDEFMMEKMKNNKAQAAYFYDLLRRKFGDTPEGEYVYRFYRSEAQITKGVRVPSFSVSSLDNMAERITNKSLLGKYYLVFFWAAEDRHSASQIQYLNEAYKKYKGDNFDILTISVDSSYTDLINFRKNKYRMPWLNAYVGRNRKDKTVKAFRAYNIPKAFLVSPKGVILAEGKKLLGPELKNSLEEYLGR